MGEGRLAQYIIRNTFSIEKLTYINETVTVIYRSKMSHGNDNKKRFEVYTAEEFIPAITQHFPERPFQMVPGNKIRTDINSNYMKSQECVSCYHHYITGR